LMYCLHWASHDDREAAPNIETGSLLHRRSACLVPGQTPFLPALAESSDREANSKFCMFG
jgi:hypothetical protein